MASGTALVLSDAFAGHATAPGHPERPERIVKLNEVLSTTGLRALCREIAPVPASEDDLRLNHSAEYIDRFQKACARGQSYIDCPDSSICPESFTIALKAAGSTLACVDEVMEGRVRNAFAAVRPPGHHAEYAMSMGFCMFNNIALAARRLREKYGLERVMIFDFDVHHGNGTQHSFEEDPNVFFCSFHQHPASLYPGTGFEYECGRGAGEGKTLNCPMRPGSGEEEYREAFYKQFVPAVERFKPQFLLVSAGFDAHEDDFISRIDLSDASYDWLSRETAALAEAFCDGRLVSVLEGGYDLPALCRCSAIHVRALLGPAGS